MDKPTLVFSKTLLLITALLGTATYSHAQFEESIVDSSFVGRSSQSGGFYNRQFGTALRFGYQSEGYGVQKGIVTLGSMKVFNLDNATLNLDAQATLSDDFGAGYNAGIFYRALGEMGFGPDAERILGVGFWTDGQSTSADNFFNQLGVTLESLGESYDLRVQGNFPLERRKDGDTYEVEYNRIELTDVAAKTQHLPTEWIKNGNDITEAFVAYAKPIVGALPVIERI